MLLSFKEKLKEVSGGFALVVLIAISSNFLSKKDDLITVKTFGCEIIFKKIKDAILMKGPATFIYKGNINE